jgi:hypothetical protein
MFCSGSVVTNHKAQSRVLPRSETFCVSQGGRNRRRALRGDSQACPLFLLHGGGECQKIISFCPLTISAIQDDIALPDTWFLGQGRASRHQIRLVLKVGGARMTAKRP